MVKRFVLMLAFAAAIFGGIAYTKYRQFEAMSTKFSVPQPPTDVAVATVQQTSWQDTITATGSLT
ncbi:MAG: efflux RND transporter periplasmic adaptor subunit, partial [Gammaproteobacteria bacterium]